MILLLLRPTPVITEKVVDIPKPETTKVTPPVTTTKSMLLKYFPFKLIYEI